MSMSICSIEFSSTSKVFGGGSRKSGIPDRKGMLSV